MLKTIEGFEQDTYRNKLVPFTRDEQILIGRGIGGRLPYDCIPKPNKKRRRRRTKGAVKA